MSPPGGPPGALEGKLRLSYLDLEDFLVFRVEVFQIFLKIFLVNSQEEVEVKELIIEDQT